MSIEVGLHCMMRGEKLNVFVLLSFVPHPIVAKVFFNVPLLASSPFYSKKANFLYMPQWTTFVVKIWGNPFLDFSLSVCVPFCKIRLFWTTKWKSCSVYDLLDNNIVIENYLCIQKMHCSTRDVAIAPIQQPQWHTST